MREIRKSGSMRGSGRKALLRKCRLSLSTLPVSSYAGNAEHEHLDMSMRCARNRLRTKR